MAEIFSIFIGLLILFEITVSNSFDGIERLFINITDFSSCYAISERDFNDTYRVMDTENPEVTLN